MKKIILLLGFIIAIGTATAQTCENTTIIYGKALDLYGNPIPGANVSAERTGMGPISSPLGSTTTNATGDYIISLDISKLDAVNEIYLKLEKDEKMVDEKFNITCGRVLYKNLSYGLCISPTSVSGTAYYTNDTIVSIPMKFTAYIDGYESGGYTSTTGEYTVALELSNAGKSDLLVVAENAFFIGNRSKAKTIWCDYEKLLFDFYVYKKTDLVLELVSIDTINPITPDPVTINITINNTGELDANSFNVSFYYGETSIENQTISSLIGGGYVDISFTFYPNQDDYVNITVDLENAIDESNEANNELTINLNVFDCDLDNDGITISDYNDLMNAYKCFLGIESNCNEISFQDWKNMKMEYQCFTGLN